jgi:membrane peptidoglycan carboxypeptidase
LPNGKRRRRTGYHQVIDYPRQYLTGVRHWLPSWRLVLGTFLFFAAVGVMIVVTWYNRVQIPSPSDFADYQTTTVYYSDGQTVMGEFAEQNRVIVTSDAIPQYVKDAVVAGEDRTFYENPGINPVGIARAVYLNVTGKDNQGGSSITQQYAERYYVGRTVTDYRGKIEEAMLAVKLARAEDKDVILTNYLNTIYWGRDAYGIEAAAQAYFGVSAKDLTLSQGALLAGLIPSPNNFDPRISPEDAERRWNYVMDGMVTTGALTQAERDDEVYPTAVEFNPPDIYAGDKGYLLDMVRRELVAEGFAEEDLDQAGYRIVTTIDQGLQGMAVSAVQSMPADHSPNLKAGLVTLQPETGAILALYGGPDYLTSPLNIVTQGATQAGSTFKPFTLIAYLENGGSLRSKYMGTNRIAVEGFPEGVRNYGDSSYGNLEVTEATARSVNAVYAQMNLEVGPATTLEVAQRAGACASWARQEEDCGLFDNQEVISNVLGTASPHPLDMAQAFNTYASGGSRTEPFIVKSVEYIDDGTVAYENKQTPVQEFAPDVMADTVYALTQVVEAPGGTAHGAADVGQPVAGKTGSSNDNKSAWFIGFTSHMTTAVVLYQEGVDADNKVVQESITPFGGYQYVTGGTVPLDIWTAFMVPAHQGREVIPFPARADIGEPNTPPLVQVPNVVGMTEGEATTTIQGAGLLVMVLTAPDDRVPAGEVVSQDPGGGEAEQGSTVTIVVSTGRGEPERVDVPRVVGQKEADARGTLEGAGFVVVVENAEDETVPAGRVISQDPSGGKAEPGSTVKLVVSTGPPVVDPPPVDPPPGGGGG